MNRRFFPDRLTMNRDADFPALRFAVLLAAGILLAYKAIHLWPVPAAFFTVTLLLSLIFRGRPACRLFSEAAFFLFVICCAFAFLGFSRSVRQGGDSLINGDEFSRGKKIGPVAAMLGRMDGPCRSVHKAGQLPCRRCVFKVEAIQGPGSKDWVAAGCRVLLTLPDDPALPLYGNERLGLVAEMKRPSGVANPGGFDYRKYLLERSIIAESIVHDPGDVVLLGPGKTNVVDCLNPVRWAGWLRAAVYRNHEVLYGDNRVRAMASALLLGVREQLPPVVRDDFIMSGTMHLLVVSGLHVGFIAWALYLFFSLVFGRGWACCVLVSAAVLFFALVCGGRPSVLRSSVMCAFVLLALPLQRRSHLLNTLGAAFSVLLIARPEWLMDIGFQLSFAAVTGVVFIVPRLESLFQGRSCWENRFARYAIKLCLVSLAAQVAVTPLIAYYFLRVSPVGLVANVLMVPLAGAAVIAGFAVDILAFISAPAAQAAAGIFSMPARALLCLASFFSQLPGAWFEINPPRLYDIALWWLAVFFAVGLVRKRKNAAHLALVCLVWLNIYLWVPVFGSLGQDLRMRFLDLGRKGSAVVLECGGKRALLLDVAGDRGESMVREVVIPYLARYHCRGVDWLILREVNRAGVASCLRIVDRFRVGAVVVPPVVSQAPLYRFFLDHCLGQGVSLRVPLGIDSLALADARIVLLGPDEEVFDYSGRLSRVKNEAGACLVGLVRYGGGQGKRILLAGAAEECGLERVKGYPGSFRPGFEVAELPGRVMREAPQVAVPLAGRLLTVAAPDPAWGEDREAPEFAGGFFPAAGKGSCGAGILTPSVNGSIGLRYNSRGALEISTWRDKK
ncbi:MAG: ComEC/Rec2 family competence protein [Gemmatimonadota bacterium]|nr:ComEC/Rec2 family competence protein [Gemmatimonadota bacterium]